MLDAILAVSIVEEAVNMATGGVSVWDPTVDKARFGDA